MARAPNRTLPGVKRSQACVRYDDQRRDNFKVYASFGAQNSTISKFFRCFIKCYECKARGNPESDGLKRFPELQGVMEAFLPVKPLPADFENRLEKDRRETLGKLASIQAKEAAGIYERNQAAFLHDDNQANSEPSSVSLNEECGSGNQQDDPEARLPPFSDQQLIDMLFSELGRRASSFDELSLTLQVVKTHLMNWLNGLETQERSGVDSSSSLGGTLAQKNPMPPSPLGSQLEGSSIRGGGENVRSPFSQIFEELGEEQLELFDPVDGGQQHDHELLAHEGDDNQTNHPDNMQVDATYHDSADLLVDARSWSSGSDLEELFVQQFHDTRAKGVGWDASFSHSLEVFMENGNTESLSDILEDVPWHTGRNRADMEGVSEQLSPPDRFTDYDWSAFVQEYIGEKYLADPNQYSADLRDQVNAPNPAVSAGY